MVKAVGGSKISCIYISIDQNQNCQSESVSHDCWHVKLPSVSLVQLVPYSSFAGFPITGGNAGEESEPPKKKNKQKEEQNSAKDEESEESLPWWTSSPLPCTPRVALWPIQWVWFWVELMKFDFRHVLPRAARRRGDNSSPSKTFQNRKAWQFEKKREPGAFSCRFMAGKPMLETISRLGSESSFLEMAATMMMKLWINLRSSSRLTPVAIFVWSHDVAEARSSCHACGAWCGAETARLGLARLGDHQRSRCWVLEDRNMRQEECSVAEHTTCCHRRALRPWVRGHGFYLARRQVPSDVLQTLSRTLLWLVHDEPLPWTVCWPQPQICGAPCIFKSGSPRIGRPSFPCTWQCWNFSPSSAGCRCSKIACVSSLGFRRWWCRTNGCFVAAVFWRKVARESIRSK